VISTEAGKLRDPSYLPSSNIITRVLELPALFIFLENYSRSDREQIDTVVATRGRKSL
jgi:hypothetical protein